MTASRPSGRKPGRPAAKRAKTPRARGRGGVLARVRRMCLALPEAHEKIAWGAPTFRVRDRQFAMFLDNHHGDGRLALWCKASPGSAGVARQGGSGAVLRPAVRGAVGLARHSPRQGLDWASSPGSSAMDTWKRRRSGCAPASTRRDALRPLLRGGPPDSARPRGHVRTGRRARGNAGPRAPGRLRAGRVARGHRVPWQRVVNAQGRISLRGDGSGDDSCRGSCSNARACGSGRRGRSRWPSFSGAHESAGDSLLPPT